MVSSNRNAANVRYGVELNPVSLTGVYLSGGFDAFFPDQALELAISFVYKGQLFEGCDYEFDHDVRVDLVFRKYLTYAEQSTMPFVGLLLAQPPCL